MMLGWAFETAAGCVEQCSLGTNFTDSLVLLLPSAVRRGTAVLARMLYRTSAACANLQMPDRDLVDAAWLLWCGVSYEQRGSHCSCFWPRRAGRARTRCRGRSPSMQPPTRCS